MAKVKKQGAAKRSKRTTMDQVIAVANRAYGGNELHRLWVSAEPKDAEDLARLIIYALIDVHSESDPAAWQTDAKALMSVRDQLNRVIKALLDEHMQS